MPRRIQQRGQQTVLFARPDRPGSSSVYSMIRTTRPPSSRSAESGRRVELGQVRAAAQAADRSKHQVVLDPCQQVGSTLPHLLHQLVTQETTVPQQQHVRQKKTQQVG